MRNVYWRLGIQKNAWLSSEEKLPECPLEGGKLTCPVSNVDWQ